MPLDLAALLGAQATGAQFSIVIDGVTYRVVQVDSTGALVTAGGGVTAPIMLTPASRWSLGPDMAANAFAAHGTSPWPSANRAIYVPFVAPESITVVKLFAGIGGVTSGNLDVGIYNQAGARQVSSGSTAMGPINTLQEFDVADTVLAAGRYYLAMAVSNVTASIQRWAYPVVTGGIEWLQALGVAQEAAALPLPATATFAVVAVSYFPLVGISLRTLVS